MADRLRLVHGRDAVKPHLERHGGVVGFKDPAAAVVGTLGDAHIGRHDAAEHQSGALLAQDALELFLACFVVYTGFVTSGHNTFLLWLKNDYAPSPRILQMKSSTV